MTRVTWVVGLLAVAVVDPSRSARAGDGEFGASDQIASPGVIYDNIAPNGGLDPGGASPASQYDAAFPFDAGATDDFMLPASPLCTWTVTGVRWSGVFWGPDEPGTITGFRVVFWPDVAGDPDGGGGAVPNLSEALGIYAIAGNANPTPNPTGAETTFDYSVQLPQPLQAIPGVRYWIQIQPVMASPVQWGWHITNDRRGADPRQYFDLLEIPTWTSVPDAGDLAFALIGEAHDIGCDDGNACTVDTCAGNNCVFTPIQCNDGVACTVDACVNGACVYAAPPNFDGEGDVDLNDFKFFLNCLENSEKGAATLSCKCADLNNDSRIDLRDFALFQTSYSGAE